MILDARATEEQLKVERNGDDNLAFTVTDKDGAGANVSGASFSMLILPREQSDDAAKIVQVDDPAFTREDVNHGLMIVKISRTAKSPLHPGATYWYRLMMTEANQDVTVLGRGKFSVD